MKVFKFGGASVASEERIRNVARILRHYQTEKLLIVVSAMGKTTNHLENVVERFYKGDQTGALSLFNNIRKEHQEISIALLGSPLHPLQDFFTEIEWLLHDKPVKNFDYYYDQVVCVGELLSSRILSAFLQTEGINNKWLDVRDILRTDDNFRDARIDWQVTAEKINAHVLPVLSSENIIVTQGFIGSTDENESTTLGREGSDYTAAVFANLLDADNQTIWKDVQGVMNADPKQYQKAEWIRELNYREVIEMAYYGAQVIHPKTIKPLQNKDIPLYVKSFLNPEEEGTIIHNHRVKKLPPIIVYKHDQALVELNSRDFSFVGEGLTAELYRIFEKIKFRPNLTQNAAISLLCVVDDHQEKVERLASEASAYFDVSVTKGLKLLTIRHYNEEILAELCKGCEIVLRQQTPETIQVLLRKQ
jgi:aspartate kinase